ncbi:hypothetical protein F9U64_08055 [Gracilibacillus oryzae]|uniref:Uncharacterized protein n=1 Tax=Gracilibacillus oryzae TaxID=1672701 RepID=A0A7C8KZ29_9BACI|nr:hypothetical protein [Gracilibacillus oryzae]KAB8137750.1 hypothetical protein F9U64_08055 [Gracilibacillus oryzae]
MKKVKKIFKGIGISVVVIFALLVIIGLLLPGPVTVIGQNPEGDNVDLATSDYITDEDYEPGEKDFLSHTMAVLDYLDHHKWGEVDDHFASELVLETELRKAYVAENVDPDDISEIEYIVRDKQYAAYMEEGSQTNPISTNSSNGVEWATFPYDVWVQFQFELTRIIHLEDDSTQKDVFLVTGDYPPVWQDNVSETYWRLNGLMFQKLDTATSE